jgi:hypothetical protein
VADNDADTSTDNNQGGKTVLDQAIAAINKGAKEAVVNQLKEVLKRRKEAERTVALCNAEAKKIVDDYTAGLL